MGEVPVLEHGGTRLSQSGVILDYLAGALGQFGARDDDERREILRWLLFDNHKLTSYTATLPVHAHVRRRTPNAAVIAEFRKRAEGRVGHSRRASRGRRFVVGDRLTIADLSLCGYLFWPTRSASTGTLSGIARLARAHPRRCRAGCIRTS